MTRSQKLAAVPLAAALLLGGGAVAGYAGLASAQGGTPVNNATASQGIGERGMGIHRGPGGHGVAGTVSAVNGNTITVTGSNGTTYTVDVSNAKVNKVVDLSVSDVKVGDSVGVQGSVSGTSVTATHIMDGVPPAPQGPPQQQ